MDSETLLRNLNAASNDIKKCVGGKAGQGIENRYGEAYWQCVRAGLKPPLKKKYRSGG